MYHGTNFTGHVKIHLLSFGSYVGISIFLTNGYTDNV
jgi:hypothetical protein